MDKASKAETSIKNTCDQIGITSDGRKWLDVALDPFKDILQKPTGYPDRIGSHSVVQTVHASVDISAPAPDVGNWDCNIFLDSIWKQTLLRQTAQVDPININLFKTDGSGVTNYARGGLVVRSAGSNVPLTIVQTRINQCIDLVDDVFAEDTSARIIAIGMEIHNTTSELHKQGSIIVYRVDDSPVEYPITLTKDGTTAVNNSTYTAHELVDPPTVANQALDLPGSLQWDAAKGAYIVPLLTTPTSEPQDLRPLIPMEVTPGLFYLPISAYVNNYTYFSNVGNARVPITLSGAFLTGLSQETTLTVNLTYYIEQFPSYHSPLHRITSPSPCEDIKAIELYTKVARQLPTGVKVNDNFAGAFISGIASLMRAAIPHIPRMISIGSSISGLIKNTQPTPERTLQITQPIVKRPVTIVTRNAPVLDIVEAGLDVAKTIQNRPSTTTTTTTTRTVKPATTDANPRNARRVRNRRNRDYDRLTEYSKKANAGSRYLM